MDDWASGGRSQWTPRTRYYHELDINEARQFLFYLFPTGAPSRLTLITLPILFFGSLIRQASNITAPISLRFKRPLYHSWCTLLSYYVLPVAFPFVWIKDRSIEHAQVHVTYRCGWYLSDRGRSLCGGGRRSMGPCVSVLRDKHESRRHPSTSVHRLAKN